MTNKAEVDEKEKIQVYYVDTDNEKITIQEDSDLLMAYAVCASIDKKIKF